MNQLVSCSALHHRSVGICSTRCQSRSPVPLPSSPNSGHGPCCSCHGYLRGLSQASESALEAGVRHSSQVGPKGQGRGCLGRREKGNEALGFFFFIPTPPSMDGPADIDQSHKQTRTGDAEPQCSGGWANTRMWVRTPTFPCSRARLSDLSPTSQFPHLFAP